jgi:hypothetical protein
MTLDRWSLALMTLGCLCFLAGNGILIYKEMTK